MQIVGDLCDGVAEITAADGRKVLGHIEALDAPHCVTVFREKLIVGSNHANPKELPTEREIYRRNPTALLKQFLDQCLQ